MGGVRSFTPPNSGVQDDKQLTFQTSSKKDFRNKIRIAKKEAKETIYWIELIIEANHQLEKRTLPLLSESREPIKILGTIYDKINKYDSV